jgi:hypothetical protein
MSTEPLDLAAIMSEHGGHHASLRACCDCGDPDPHQAQHCLQYRLADTLARIDALMSTFDGDVTEWTGAEIAEMYRAALAGEQS